MTRKVQYSGLGITDTSSRQIASGAEYEGLFPQPEGTDPIVNPHAEVYDTLAFVKKVINDTLSDTKLIAPKLSKGSVEATLKSDFNFFRTFYRYKLDAPGKEQVRRPARAWADRKKGIDCDCFSTSVSQLLLNQGIENYLKIIAINGLDYFQHIYVIVPKYKGANINIRSNYWVMDPVLPRFDEEAPNITKSDVLKMPIPLQYLNGLGQNGIGLGSEFEGLENELSGADDIEGLGWQKFRSAMEAHVRNTRRKIEASPSSVEAMYQPEVLASKYRKLEGAFAGTDDELFGTLEHLSKTEDEALHPHFRCLSNAVHMHDDHLYGSMFGDIDDNMLGIVTGLGKKHKASSKASHANKKGKSGAFTKLKNAAKKAKAVTKEAAKKGKAAVKKAAKTVKHIAKKVVKYNPVSLAARAGFLIAMRTNFGKIAEKAYWGYQTEAFAKSKGISSSYWNKCVQLLAKITKVFVGTLKGDASALKKAVMNGRAAKKVSKQLKKKGMKGLGTLMGVGSLGVVTEASVTAALAFLTPLIAFMNNLFGKKKDANGNVTALENENGTESPAPEATPDEVQNSAKEADSPSDTTNDNDGSVEQADQANDEPPSTEEDNYNENFKAASGNSASSGGDASTGGRTKSKNSASDSSSASSGDNADTASDTASDNGDGTATDKDGQPEKKSGKTGLILLGVGGALVAAAMLAGKKDKTEKKESSLNGLGSVKSREKIRTVKLT